MKTLDEVINALEICGHDESPKCPYFDTEHWCCCEDHMRSISPLKNDALHYLKILKAKNEEPPLGEPPDYIPLGFHQLAEMIGEPVYIKDRGCKGHWEIITAVRKNLDGEDYAIRGNDRWQRIGNCIYRTKEGAEE